VELMCLSFGVKIGYSSPLTLTTYSPGLRKGCLGDITLLKPTILTTVPIILDRFRKDITSKLSSSISPNLLNYAISYKKSWLERGFQTPLLDCLFFSRMKAFLGGHVRIVFCGGAPLSQDTQHFIRSCLGAKILQGYGITEVSGVVSITDMDELRVGLVGPPAHGVAIKLADWEEGKMRPAVTCDLIQHLTYKCRRLQSDRSTQSKRRDYDSR
jgi:long-chain acyl-CoA synthetase